MPRVPTIWLQGKKPDEQEAIKSLLLHNSLLIDKILELINHFEKEEIRAETEISQYDSPAWSHKQADRNGARRAYTKLRAIFNFQET